MSTVFRNWIIILVSLTVALGIATAIGNATSPQIGAILRALILLGASAVGVIDAIMRILGKKSLLGRGNGAGRLLAIVQLIASLILASSLLAI